MSDTKPTAGGGISALREEVARHGSARTGSSRIDDRTLSEIRSSTALFELLAAEGADRAQLDRAERSGRGTLRCPLHDEERGKALSIWIHEGSWLWRCHGRCQTAGDAITLAAIVHPSATFPEAVRIAAETVGIRIDETSSTGSTVPKRRATKPKPVPEPLDPETVRRLEALTTRAHELLAAEDLDGLAPADRTAIARTRRYLREGSSWRWLAASIRRELVDRYRLGALVPSLETEARALGIPVSADLRLWVPERLADGTVWSGQVRAIVRPAPVKAKSRTGMHDRGRWIGLAEAVSRWRTVDPAEHRRTLWICEGLPDLLSLVGYGDTIGAPDRIVAVATSTAGTLGRFVGELVELFPGLGEVRIATDADPAGDRYSDEIVAALRGQGLRLVRIRSTVEGEDISDYLARVTGSPQSPPEPTRAPAAPDRDTESPEPSESPQIVAERRDDELAEAARIASEGLFPDPRRLWRPEP